jgi:hypothetical protein
MRKPACGAFVIVAAMVALSACGPDISDQTYDQIATGMTLDEVNNILGADGENEVVGGVQTDRSGLMGTTNSESLPEQTYVWKESGLNKPEIIVTFRDGKVITKHKNNF